MIMLPGHHSQKQKKPATVVEEAGATAGPSTHTANERKAPDQVPTRTVLGKDQAGTKTPLEAGPGIGAIRSEFDEYGAELEPEARVWKTYVKEADRFDAEKVEEWNKSLDVILIFAALFSAISTAFVIESAKRLQEDVAETSAQTLTIISQTLLAIANNTQPLTLPESSASTDRQFTASNSDICINALWFLSLSISVAVSLIAMLAKEWCHQFMSGRTGQPGAQAKRRQERWDALQRWKMPELLMFLPSLIHLALLLFAIGLCIYLWELHLGVAIPVVVVTAGATGVYAASTILPFLDHLCPYTTTPSKFIMSLLNILSGGLSRGRVAWTQDLTVTRALCWLIEKCEDPQSVDIALQAIAGAGETLPLDPLKKCEADKMMCQRLVARSTYLRDYETTTELYARGFTTMNPPTSDSDKEKEIYNDVDNLRIKIRSLQMVMEREVGALLLVQEFVPTRFNLSALRVGSMAASHCLQSLSYEDQAHILAALEPAIGLLERVGQDPSSLHPASLQSLLIGTGMLFSCSLVYGAPSAMHSYAMRLLYASHNSELLEVPLTSLALAQSDYPGWTHPPPLGPAARAERAIEAMTYHAPLSDDQIDEQFTSFGSLGLLLHASQYCLNSDDIVALTSRFSGADLSRKLRLLELWSSPAHHVHIHTLPRSLAMDTFIVQAVASRLANPKQLDDIWESQEYAQVVLTVLRRCGIGHPGLGIPAPQVYVFLVELLARNLGSNQLWRLLHEFPRLTWTPELVSLIQSRNILPLLVNQLYTTDQNSKTMAMAQLFLFTKLALRGLKDSPKASTEVGNLFPHDEPCNLRRCLESVEEGLGHALSEPPKGLDRSVSRFATRVLNYAHA